MRGVISAESPSTWPAEALKAQAVAARTYAVTTNVGTTTRRHRPVRRHALQMYKGVPAEFPSTDAAVAATAGQVVAQNGKPVTTYFFSTSGGHTENIEDSFIGALPRTWLKGVEDPYDAISPRHNWGPFTFSQATVQAKLKGLVRGSFRGITVLERGRRRGSCAPRSTAPTASPRSPARSCARVSGCSTPGRRSPTSRGPRSSPRTTTGAAGRRPSSPRPPCRPAHPPPERRSRPTAAAPPAAGGRRHGRPGGGASAVNVR